METIGLAISCVLCIVLIIYLLSKKKRNQLQGIFIINFVIMLGWCVLLILQKYICSFKDIDPIFFDYFTYIFICFLPVSLFFTGVIFANTKIKFKRIHLALFIIPIISLIMLWTNDYHHLFYVQYSTDLDKAVFGVYMYVHSIYSYILDFIGLYLLLKYSIKNSGLFSKQAILFIIAALVPATVNILGALRVIHISIYLTPISFSITMILCALAIFKYKMTTVTPIALQRIVDRMSDSYLVLNDDDVITDFNATFLSTFDLKDKNVRNVNIYKLIDSKKEHVIDTTKLEKALEEAKKSTKTVTFDKYFSAFNKYFHIEINTITANKNFLGTLILLKDTTQHMQDMKIIKDNQSMLMEKERLATLGQMVGGIAHNLKTPIMSIAGAMEGMEDLITEYDKSIEDPDVTTADHHAIAKDMREWVDKVNSYDAYMSDIITTVKGQAVNFNDVSSEDFTIDELVKRINILMKHELKNALVILNINCAVPESTVLHGNINSLVQIVNNLISNSIQSYGDSSADKKIIDLTIVQESNNIVISVADHGCGIPKDVQEKLFKSMITTKGHNGTGLGLFMSYSTIKGNFNGDLSFTSEVGKGTKFNITLPL